jgi:hypothetical protein
VPVVSLLMQRGVNTDYGTNVAGDKVEVFAPPSAEMQACLGGDGSAPGGALAVSLTRVVAPDVSPPEMSQQCQALFNAPQKVAATYSLTELGVDPLVIANAGTRTHVFVSTAGSAFAEVSLPPSRVEGSFNGSGGSILLSYDDGFLLARGHVVGNGVTTELLLSADGRAWESGESVDAAISSFGVSDGRPILVLQRPVDTSAPEVVAIAADGSIERRGSWPHPVNGYQGGTDTVVVGGAGVIGVAGTRSNPEESQSVDFNGNTFTMTNTETGSFLRVVDTASGEVLIDRLPAQDQAITIPAHGNVKASTVRLEDIWVRISWASQASYVKSLQILDSPDGKTWTSTKLSELIDLKVDQVISVGNIIVDKDKYIVNLSIAPQTGSIPKTITLVGRRK